MPDKVPVTFTESHGAYNGGETAGFSREYADRLIAAKVAVPFKKSIVTKAVEALTGGDLALTAKEKNFCIDNDAVMEPQGRREGFFFAPLTDRAIGFYGCRVY